jgi:hypothetical protein
VRIAASGNDSMLIVEVADDGVGGATAMAVRACEVSPNASRRSAGG